MSRRHIYKKILCGVTTLALLMAPVCQVNAASEYTITFRPGNVGKFGIVSDEEKSVEDMAQEVADIYYGEYETSVTANGAIKVKVPAGADMPVVPAYIIPEEGYCVRPWGPEAGTKVNKNADYVVDYGRLINGVEYTVKYVDAQSQESIAPFLTAYGNIGDTVTMNAPTQITTSDAGAYVLKSVATQSIELSEEQTANIMVFAYEYSYDAGTVTEDVITYLPGDTVVTTETHTTYIDNGTEFTGAVVLENQEAEAEENVAGEDVAVNPENQEEVQEEVQEDIQDEQVDQGTVEIEEEDVPLADTSDTEEIPERGLEEIEDDETALAAGQTKQINVAAMILASATGVMAGTVAIIWLVLKKKRLEEEE